MSADKCENAADTAEVTNEEIPQDVMDSIIYFCECPSGHGNDEGKLRPLFEYVSLLLDPAFGKEKVRRVKEEMRELNPHAIQDFLGMLQANMRDEFVNYKDFAYRATDINDGIRTEAGEAIEAKS